MTQSEFDSYAGNYDAALDRGLVLSGESKEYFACERVRWLARCLGELSAQPSRVLDYGCGTGAAAPELLRQLNATLVMGVDTSSDMVAVARRTHLDPRLQFATVDDSDRSTSFDLAYCNGVFHHIEPDARLDALASIRGSLSAGGYFAFWENNPWNPGTRILMSRIPFDRDAKLVSSRAAHALLARAGFRILRTDFLFLFPRALAALRPLETKLVRVPAGAQYQVLCQRIEC